MSKQTKIILKSINYLIITAVVLLAVLLVGVKLFGIQIYTVLSSSMEPTYKVGSLIYVTRTNIEELQEGDTITFKITDKVTATHRIVEIIEESNERKFSTKGDANDYIDENIVESTSIIGTPIFTIPFLGYIASFMQTTSGKLITIGIGILLVIIVIVNDSLIDNKKNKINKQIENKPKE